MIGHVFSLEMMHRAAYSCWATRKGKTGRRRVKERKDWDLYTEV